MSREGVVDFVQSPTISQHDFESPTLGVIIGPVGCSGIIDLQAENLGVCWATLWVGYVDLTISRFWIVPEDQLPVPFGERPGNGRVVDGASTGCRNISGSSGGGQSERDRRSMRSLLQRHHLDVRHPVLMKTSNHSQTAQSIQVGQVWRPGPEYARL